MIPGSITATEGPERQRDKVETPVLLCPPPLHLPGTLHYIPQPPSSYQPFLAACWDTLGKGSGERGVTGNNYAGGVYCTGSPELEVTRGGHTWILHCSTSHGVTSLSLPAFLSGLCISHRLWPPSLQTPYSPSDLPPTSTGRRWCRPGCRRCTPAHRCSS